MGCAYARSARGRRSANFTPWRDSRRGWAVGIKRRMKLLAWVWKVWRQENRASSRERETGLAWKRNVWCRGGWVTRVAASDVSAGAGRARDQTQRHYQAMNVDQLTEQLRAEGFGHTCVWQDRPHANYSDHTHATETAHIILEGEMTSPTMVSRDQHYVPQVGESVATFPAVPCTRPRWGRRAAAILSARSSCGGEAAVEQFEDVQDLLTRAVDFDAGAHSL